MAVTQQAMQKRRIPPHLRAASGSSNCGNCRYFKAAGAGKGKCRMYSGYPVSSGQICDSYKPRGG